MCFFAFDIKSEKKDSLLGKKNNIIYILPTAVFGDLWAELNNYWLELGYARKLSRSNDNFVDIKFGIIVYSTSTRIDILTNFSSKSSTGYNLNLEHRVILVKKFYYSTNLFYQQTRTIREGEYHMYNKVSNNTYKVIRNVYCILPKIGFQFINRKNHIYTDVGLGIGIRYVQSFSAGKINNEIFSGRELFVDKDFDKGSQFAQRVSFQVKIGYNF